MDQYYTLMPENVDIHLEGIDQELKTLSIPGYSLDNLREIISLICYHCYKDEGNRAHLKIEYLRKYVPHAELYLRGLQEIGVIESSGSYQVGVTAKTYSFTEPYESRYLKYEITDQKLKNRISKAQQALKRRNSKKYPIQNSFISTLKIDPEVHSFIEYTYSGGIAGYNYAMSSATRIEQGDIKFSVDDTSGRYHSNLTNMPKVMRKFVTVKGVHLKNVDIKNSQPYISTMVLTCPEVISAYAKYSGLSKLLSSLKVDMTDDVKKYIDLVISGRLYEYILEEFQRRGLPYTTREEVKEQVLIILFDRNVHLPRSRKVFSELFPEVHRVFSLIKGDESGNKFKSFQRFAILLQRIESHVILNIIVDRLNKEHPEIITATVHDSIMTSIYTDQVKIVYETMEEELLKFVGYPPTLKIE